MNRVAITGLGVVSPLGDRPDTLFSRLIAGESGIGYLPETFDARLRTRIAAPAAFDGSAYFSGPRRRQLDRVSQFALAAAAQAVKDARLTLASDEAAHAGVFLGTGMGGAHTTDQGYQTLYRDGSDRIHPFSVLMAMNNAAAAWIGMQYALAGPNLTYSTACSSSAVAIGEAGRRIARGELTAAITGGAEAPLTFGTLMAWDALKTLADQDPADPAASCKPFAKNRTGMVLGEGAGIVVLENWERARRRGANIYAELSGYGLTTDTGHITRPSVEGQVRALKLALESAQIAPQQVGYINAHGTGTTANDPIETAAIKRAFGAYASSIPVSSTKSMHGHLLGAASAIELIASVKALGSGRIPPTRHLVEADPECDLDYVPDLGRRGESMEAVMSSSFAFGGTNAVLVCGHAER